MKIKVRTFSMFLCLMLVLSILPFYVFATKVDESKLPGYQVVSEQEWQLAPGISESEIVLNNEAGTKRQVTHVVEVDPTNPYVRMIPSYKGMEEGMNAGKYGTQIMSAQAKYAEENGYGDVVAAMNTCLHWYDTDYYVQHPELVGEPLGTLIIDGVKYSNSQNSYFGAYTCIVINYDEKDGVTRPNNMPKVEVRQTYDAITGWEEQLIPASFHFLVKDGVNQHSINDPEPAAPRTMMGIKADGTIIFVMVEGRQAPFSIGINAYEMAEYMISLGCVQAINCDGGGSSTFLSQRPGEDLELHCSPSDGAERPVTHGVLIMTTATNSHEHVPGEKTDKAPTNTEPGFSGRVICTVCGIVLEEGVELPVIGHTYSVDVANQKIVCDCGCVFDKTGLQNVNGKTYYTVSGKLTSGWVLINNDWYYFDAGTFEGWDGEQYTSDGVRFSFEKGRVTSGVWVRSSDGKRYWYGPGYYRDATPEATSCRPYEIDGKTYLFNRKGYMQTGVAAYFDATTMVNGQGVMIYYDCGEDGVATLLTGPYNGYFYKDGLKQKCYQLVEFEGNYYFINDGHRIATNKTMYLSNKFLEGTGLLVGSYSFDAEGKMVIKNGPQEDGTFYLNGIQQKCYQLVAFEGNYYFINDGHKIVKNRNLYLAARFLEGTGLTVGSYSFDAEGKMVIKNGPQEDGTFYLNGIQQKCYQLVEFEGNYYFINDGHKIVKNRNLYLAARFVEDVGLPVGSYSFDAEGKMVIKNGPQEDSTFYINNVQQKCYQLIGFEGNYYFINDGHKIVKNRSLYLSNRFLEGTGLPVGSYSFDVAGKMVIKNGPQEDGTFYINNVQQKCYQLIEFEGNYYFINDGHKIVKNRSIYLSNRFLVGTDLAVGSFSFDAEGKMILK